jgi:predicted nuclease of restriction endonuclease-like (RecB) superfamily
MASKRPIVQRPVAQLPSGYAALLAEVKNRVRSAQYAALQAVNKELVGLYWDIGQLLSQRRARQAWGKSVVESLARDLQAEFPGMQGFSASNLWRMKLFYETYSDSPKLAPLVREIGWSHNIIVLERCSDPREREFYIRMTRKFGWSKNVLALQIENQSYEKTLLGQTNFDKALTSALRAQAKLAVKDEYTFDFLELGDEHSERELERALIDRVEHFLREMGGLYAFMGSQFRLEVAGEEYFIDLLLYHRGLSCMLAIDLKVGAFKPEHVGKMQFYLTALDRQVRQARENPSIGLILCREKNRTIVEYALHDARKPIGVATYRIVRRLPKELKGHLPGPEQIAKLLEASQ